MQATTERTRADERDGAGHDDRLARFSAQLNAGAIGGLVAGLVFLLANMGWSVRGDGPAVAPMVAISTIFNGTDMPQPGPENVVVGLVTHLMLSALFGIGLAIVAGLVRFPSVAVFAAAAVGYGLLLYVVNFQILGRTLFPWFTNPMGPPQGFEIFIHAVYGLLLVPFLLGVARTRRHGGAR